MNLNGFTQEWLTEAEAKEVFQRHINSPHISTKDYWDQRTQDLCQSISGRKKIYLDTCYWVHLREAVLGRVKKQEYVEILRILRSMVSSGIAICPVSDMAFCELMRQTDDDTRRATSELFDELSLSVALQFEEYRIRCELEAFLLRPTTPVKETLTDKIWTKASYVIGPQIPSIEGIPAEQQLLFQKSSIDLFWKRKFIDMADTSMASLDFEAIFDKKAAQINAVKNDYQHEIPSTKQALISEITGVADLFLDHAEAIIVAHGQRVRGRSFQSPTEAELQLVRKNIRNAMVNIFVYAKDKAKYMLPSMYAYALQHGAFRMVTIRIHSATRSHSRPPRSRM